MMSVTSTAETLKASLFRHGITSSLSASWFPLFSYTIFRKLPIYEMTFLTLRREKSGWFCCLLDGFFIFSLKGGELVWIPIYFLTFYPGAKNARNWEKIMMRGVRYSVAPINTCMYIAQYNNRINNRWTEPRSLTFTICFNTVSYGFKK